MSGLSRNRVVAAFHRIDADADAFVAIPCGRGRAVRSDADVHLATQLRSRQEFGPAGVARTNAADLLFPSGQWEPVVAAAHGMFLDRALVLYWTAI